MEKYDQKDKHLKSLNNLAITLKSISDRNNREARIEIGLSTSDDGYGIILVTHAKDSFQFLRDLSVFVVNTEKIYAGLQSTIENDNAQPSWYVFIEPGDNGGIILRWESDCDSHMKRII